MFLMFPDQNFSLTSDVQSVRELHESLAKFYTGCVEDTEKMIEYGKTYPLNLRMFQMTSAVTLQQTLLDTHVRMKIHAEKYKAAVSAELTETVLISCIIHNSVKNAANAEELKRNLLNLLTDVKGKETAKTFVDLQTIDYEEAQDVPVILASLHELAKNLGKFKANFSLF